jgi:hypothetical protein
MGGLLLSVSGLRLPAGRIDWMAGTSLIPLYKPG